MIKGLGEAGRQQLYISHDILMQESAGEVTGELYPDSIEVGVQRFPLSYQFKPGDVADGVTLTVPLERLNTLNEGQLQWLVPGLLRDKIISLIKNLPKPQRRSLTPVPRFADAAMERLQGVYPAPLIPALAEALKAMTGIEVDESAFDEDLLPDYLRFRVQVIDAQGECIAIGRSLPDLQEQFGQQAQRHFMDRLGSDHQRDNETDWVFDELPVSIMTEDSGGHTVKAWPAIVDQEDAVGLRVFDTAEEAAMEHHYGVLRLLTLQLSGKLRDLRRQHGITAANLLAWSAAGSPEALIDSLVHSSLLLAAGNQPVDIRDEAAFNSLRDSVRTKLGLIFRKQAGYLNKTLAIWSENSKKLDDAYYNRRPEVFNDMRAQLDDMVYEGFLQELSPARLEHYPRYLEAMSVRLLSVEDDPRRDAVRMREVEPFWRQYLELLEQGQDYDEAVDEYRWLLEEFRVSLFAQQLGTRAKVSIKRLRQAWQKIA